MHLLTFVYFCSSINLLSSEEFFSLIGGFQISIFCFVTRLQDNMLSTVNMVEEVFVMESGSPYMSLWCRLQKASMKVLYMAMFVIIGQ